MSVHALPSDRQIDASERLQLLSDVVGRIAAKLAHMSSDSELAPEQVALPAGRAPSASLIRGVIKARRLRARFLDGEFFADPAWDILLELLLAEACQYRVSVTSLTTAAHVPATTALRYISSMTDSGLLRRRPDPTDGRRMFVELTPQASDALQRYFAAVRGMQVI